MKRWSVEVVAVIVVSVLMGLQHTPAAYAATALRYLRGYSVQSGWLCYGWSSGVYHCTMHWGLRDGRYVSYNGAWVPSQPSVVPDLSSAAKTVAVSTLSSSQNTFLQPCHDRVIWPSRITQWSVPNGCFARIYYPNRANYVSRPSYGWCNWWPEVLHPWLIGTGALHLPGHNRPVPGATVYFAPGVQGASHAGHYAHVVAIAPGGFWVLVTEMNFYWRGGGWAKVNYRYIHIGYGVSFRYSA